MSLIVVVVVIEIVIETDNRLVKDVDYDNDDRCAGNDNEGREAGKFLPGRV